MKLKNYFQYLAPCLQQRAFIKKPPSSARQYDETIVSLTSIPQRYKLLTNVIASLINQSTRPSKVYLWIKTGTKHLLPKKLDRLIELGLCIEEVEDLGPHTKLIPALEKLPNLHIITADDDLIYPYHWLENLFDEHKRHNPEGITCYSARYINAFEQKGANSLRPYKQWPRIGSTIRPDQQAHALPLGYTGVVYAPNCFNSEVFNKAAFKKLCPRADDLWFKAMAIHSGTTIYKTAKNFGNEIYVPFSQQFGLKKNNVSSDGNVEQMLDLLNHYDLWGHLTATPS